MLGAKGHLQEADGQSQKIADDMKANINKLLKKNYQKFTVVNYKT